MESSAELIKWVLENLNYWVVTIHDYRKFIYPISIGSYSAAGCMESDDR